VGMLSIQLLRIQTGAMSRVATIFSLLHCCHFGWAVPKTDDLVQMSLVAITLSLKAQKDKDRVLHSHYCYRRGRGHHSFIPDPTGSVYVYHLRHPFPTTMHINIILPTI